MSLLLLLISGEDVAPEAPTYPIVIPRPRTPVLAVELELLGGRRLRFGSDEREIASVPKAISFDTELPGGFGPANITLPRPDPLTASEAELFASTRIYDAHTNQTFHEGRVVGMPLVGASEMALEVEGWAKHLADDETARQIFYDRDFAAWGGPSAQREIDLFPSLGQDGYGNAGVIDDPMLQFGTPGFETVLAGDWTLRAHAEGWFDGDGIPIAALDYVWQAATIDGADIHWIWRAWLSDDDRLDLVGGYDETGNLTTYPSPTPDQGAGTLTATASTRRFATVSLEYDTAGGITGGTFDKFAMNWLLLALIGDHGLTLQGAVSAIPDYPLGVDGTWDTGRGLLASDVVPYVVDTWAPLLNTTAHSIEATSWRIPHLTFRDRTTALAMLEGLSILGGNTSYPMDWGVFENRTLHYKSPGNMGRRWLVRRGDANPSSSDGPDASTRANGIVVTYDDGTGKTRSVGPPGSGSEYETDVLADVDPTNPANQDGARHWKVIDGGVNGGPIPGMTTEQSDSTGSVMMGRLALAAANRDEWRGSVTIQGEVADDAGNVWPAAMVRAGDELVVTDDADTRPRRIVGTSYDGSACQASVGARPDVLEVALARLGAGMVSGIATANTPPATLRQPPPKGSLAGPSGVPGASARRR